jgi:DNA-binding HxlR family transcriptional regulator
VENKMKSSSFEKTLNILLYLKKSDGNWKNTREIATYSSKVVQNRKPLGDVLEQLVNRELIDVRPAENPQAKFEYKILPKGKDTLSAFLQFMNDPDIKHIAGIKENTQFDEV